MVASSILALVKKRLLYFTAIKLSASLIRRMPGSPEVVDLTPCGVVRMKSCHCLSQETTKGIDLVFQIGFTCLNISFTPCHLGQDELIPAHSTRCDTQAQTEVLI